MSHLYEEDGLKDRVEDQRIGCVCIGDRDGAPGCMLQINCM